MAASPSNLRPEVNTFIGREAELAALGELLATPSRLVSVLGPPGIGKTRLARQLGHRLAAAAHFGGGVWFVDVTECTNESEVTAAVAAATGVALHPDLPDSCSQLAAGLDRLGPALVVLDNFEQLAPLAANSIGRWVREAPGTIFLVTSREALLLEAETRYELAPLDDRAGVALFEARARQIDPALRTDDTFQTIVTEIVHRLDGLPLAIELAAARISVLPPAELIERLSERFSVLKSDRRDVTARTATLKSAIDWSWALLSPAEREALAQCAVFRGGFTLAAAEAVIQERSAVDLLESLRKKSLVRALPGGTGRFGLYESIREYAALALTASGGAEAAEARHNAYYLSRANALAAELELGGSTTIDRIAADADNLLAVERRMRDRGSIDALRIAWVLDPLLAARGPFDRHMEILDGAVRLAEQAGVGHASARAHQLRAEARRVRGAVDGALADCEAGLAVAQDRAMIADLLDTRGRIFGIAGRQAESAASFEEELRVLGALPNTSMLRLGTALTGLGGARHECGDLPGARAAYERATTCSGSETSLLLGRIRFGLGLIALEEDDLRAAEVALDESSRIGARLGQRRFEGIARAVRGVLALFEGRADAALAALEVGSHLVGGTGDVRLMSFAESWAGAALALLDRIDEAEQRFSRAEELLRPTNDRILTAMWFSLRALVELARARTASGSARAHHFASAHRWVSRAEGPAEGMDVRLARNMYARAAQGLSEDRPALWPVLIERDGRRFRSATGPWVSLEKRRALHRVLAALALHRHEAPGGVLSIDALLAAGWPGEQVVERAGVARVYVAISTLRKLGLGDVCQSHGDGYRLDPAVVMCRV